MGGLFVGLARRVYGGLRDAVDLKKVRSRRDGSTPLFLPRGYLYRRKPVYCLPQHSSVTDVVTQPDVYASVERAATVLGCGTIIDLGCGRGIKLNALSDRYRTIGIDFGDNIEQCRATYDQGTWLEADLNKVGGLQIDPALVKGAAIVCADVIEHLPRPLALLGAIRQLLRTAPVAVISTPDREKVRGPAHLGPPPNVFHIREWTLSEFRQLVESEGLQVGYIAHTRSSSIEQLPTTILCVCVADDLTAAQRTAVIGACRDAVETPLKQVGRTGTLNS
jgi:SAM-dependent methyltransferase